MAAEFVSVAAESVDRGFGATDGISLALQETLVAGCFEYVFKISPSV